MRKFWLYISIFSLLFGMARGSGTDSSPCYPKTESEHFIFFYYPQIPAEDLEKAINLAEGQFQKSCLLNQNLECEVAQGKGKPTITINEGKYGGLYHYNGKISVSGVTAIPHEVCHWIQDVSGDNMKDMPSWIVEGYAEWRSEDNQSLIDETYLYYKLDFRADTLSLERILNSSQLVNLSDPGEAYNAAGTFVGFLISKLQKRGLNDAQAEREFLLFGRSYLKCPVIANKKQYTKAREAEERVSKIDNSIKNVVNRIEKIDEEFRQQFIKNYPDYKTNREKQDELSIGVISNPKRDKAWSELIKYRDQEEEIKKDLDIYRKEMFFSEFFGTTTLPQLEKEWKNWLVKNASKEARETN